MTETAIHTTHKALQRANQGLISGDEMLNELAAGRLSIPLSEEPVIVDGAIASWRPATVSKADGSQWVIVFSTEQLAAAYCQKNPAHSYCMTMESRWVIMVLPEKTGLVINPHGPYMLEWNAEGVDKYRKEVLGWVLTQVSSGD